MEAAENPILKWAVDLIAHAPPMQNLVAFLIVLLLALPLLRAGLRELRSSKRDEMMPRPAPVPIQIESPWLLQHLVEMHLSIEEIKRGVDASNAKADTNAASLASIAKLLRQRANRRHIKS